ncbi:MAG TPA: hypothetical protein VMW25_03905 [Clostridia bacterium]|nr:hypothetical protein [Clostridia bacterium]
MKKLVFLICLLAALFVSLPGLSLAQEAQQGEVVLPADRIIEGNYFAVGNSVVLMGTVNGDAYVAGGNVLVQGTVNGDLLVAGGTVTVTGRVSEDLRVAAGQVVVTGEVVGNMTAVGGTVTLTDSARVGDGLVAASGILSTLGPVGRGIDTAAAQITIANSVGGNVSAVVGRLILTPGANVAGNLTLVSNVDAQIQPGAQVGGTITRNQPPQVEVPEAQEVARVVTRTALTILVIDLVASLVLGLLLIWLWPVLTQAVVGTLSQQPWLSLGVGILVFILLPATVIGLAVTIVGIPLALILMTLYLIALYLTKVFVFLTIGELILPNAARGWALLLGLVIYEILAIIPFLGPIIIILTLLFGLGAIVLGDKNIYTRLRKEKLI